MKRYAFPGAVAIVLLLLVGGGILVFRPTGGTTHITAYVPRAVSIYQDSKVKILGVPVGSVAGVEPDGDRVKLSLAIDDKYKIPADAGVVLVAPAVVGDRFVQLSPAYTGGPELKDGAVIPIERSQIPAELDEIFRSLDDLNTALGPDGANSNGALSRLVDVGAANLKGNGETINRGFKATADLLETLSDNRNELVGTIDALQRFTTNLAQNDTGVRRVNADLATVSQQLNGEREELAAAFKNLAVALGTVADFVKANRDSLTSNISGLADVTQVLVRNQQALTEVLDVAPLALQNLQGTYDPQTGTLDTRGDQLFGNLIRLTPTICNALAQAGQACPPELQALTDQGQAAIDEVIKQLTGGGGGSSQSAPRPLSRLLLDGTGS